MKSASLLATTSWVAIALFAGQANAGCTPASVGNDTVLCGAATSPDPEATTVDLLAGDDVLTVDSGTYSGGFTGGSIIGNLVTGFDDDQIFVSAGSIGGNISVGGGNDIVQITGGSVSGEVRMSTGNDNLLWQGGGTIAGLIDMGPDNDLVTLRNLADGTIAPTQAITGGTILGDYAGAGGILETEVVLGDDASPTDLLAIAGASTGTTRVDVINLGGQGALTDQGIRIVRVDGASPGTFSLIPDTIAPTGEAAVIGGAFVYGLYQGSPAAPADGDWYLRTIVNPPLIGPPVVVPPLPPVGPVDPDLPVGPVYQPGVPLYEAYPQVLMSLNRLPTLQQRKGSRVWSGTADPQPFVKGALASTPPGDVIEATGYGVGGTLTWYGQNGLYVDGQAQATWYDSDIYSDTLNVQEADGNNGFGYAFSIEAGKAIDIAYQWTLTPQRSLSIPMSISTRSTMPFRPPSGGSVVTA